MTKRWLGRSPWLAPMVVLGGILLLAARVNVQTLRIPESSVGGRLTALVTCVLLATAVDPSSSTSASGSETTASDCESSMPDHLRAAWMTPC